MSCEYCCRTLTCRLGKVARCTFQSGKVHIAEIWDYFRESRGLLRISLPARRVGVNLRKLSLLKFAVWGARLQIMALALELRSVGKAPEICIIPESAYIRVVVNPS